ncbi:RNA-directed DNA polymerase from mobile element jockey [Trichonephila clavipes]|nr:RNA-directed DNA polymerase from mobile element jockey [Trichonephila clavipes]
MILLNSLNLSSATQTHAKDFIWFLEWLHHWCGISGYPEGFRPCMGRRTHIYKLIINNFPPAIIHILYSYLTDRNYHVRVNDTLSDTHHVNIGVTQGSLLGPVLFNIYVNDIPSHPSTMINLYADDTAISATNKNTNFVTRALNKHLALLEEYFNKWKIKINVDKTIAVLFTKRRNPVTPPTLYSTPIPSTNLSAPSRATALRRELHLRRREFINLLLACLSSDDVTSSSCTINLQRRDPAAMRSTAPRDPLRTTGLTPNNFKIHCKTNVQQRLPTYFLQNIIDSNRLIHSDLMLINYL